MLLRELVENLASHGVTVKEATGTLDVEVARVVEDSRQVRPGDLFVARGGTKLSGADYVADAVAKGAVAVVMERHEGTEAQRHEGNAALPGRLGTSVPAIFVDDVAMALAVLAHAILGWPGREMTCVGVTGTKGKTTVAYLLRSVLKAAGRTVGMIGTVEIDDGKMVVPAEMTTPGPVEMAGLMAKMRDNGVGYLVMEVSSHALHQKRVAGIDFKVAIFTNLTGDHLDYHKTMEEYAAAKALLFEGLKPNAFAIVNADDKWAGRMVEGCKAKVVRYGIATRPKVGSKTMPETLLEHGCTSLIWKMTSEGMGVTFAWERTEAYGMETPLVGRHNCYNMTAVMATVDALGLQRLKAARDIKAATGAPGRLQRVEWDGDFQIFVDYAHTHDALENVLGALRTTMGDVPPNRDREGATVKQGQACGSLPDGRGSDVLAYFITFRSFATWLHGEPGSVDPKHNIVGTPFIPPDPRLMEMKRENLKEPPFELSLQQRRSVLATLLEVAAFRGWRIEAANVRTTHVHLVVRGNAAPEKMMNDFKSYATRRMREASLLAQDQQKVWSRHGSTRWLWKHDDVVSAVQYTLEEQGECPEGTSVNPNRDREGATVRQGQARGSLPHGRGSDGRLICVFGCGGDRDRTKRPKMGAIAQRLADVAIVTSDNPRTEEPGAIIEEVCAGFAEGWRESGRVFVEADRRAAITMAIGMAQKGDVVLIAGKGHENYQIVGMTKHHFDDVEEATAAIENRLKPVLRT